MMELQRVLRAVDAANARDPGLDEASGEPAALLYGQRMSARLATFAPDADAALQIAVRGQHIERWSLPRTTFPMDRAGYHRWRNELKDYHARRLGDLMCAEGFSDEVIARVGQIVRKERFKLDPQAQTLEDVACLVFLEWYLAEFATKHETGKVRDIIAKTWRKMSPAGQVAAGTLQLDPKVKDLVKTALAD